LSGRVEAFWASILKFCLFFANNTAGYQFGEVEVVVSSILDGQRAVHAHVVRVKMEHLLKTLFFVAVY